jgi:hypothetical protein
LGGVLRIELRVRHLEQEAGRTGGLQRRNTTSQARIGFIGLYALTLWQRMMMIFADSLTIVNFSNLGFTPPFNITHNTDSENDGSVAFFPVNKYVRPAHI